MVGQQSDPNFEGNLKQMLKLNFIVELPLNWMANDLPGLNPIFSSFFPLFATYIN